MLDNARSYYEFYKGKKFEKITIIVGQDFFNSGSDGNTSKGTRQDNDTRPAKMFKKGVEAMIQLINIFTMLSDNIDVELVQGNHDFEVSFYLAVALEFYYNNLNNFRDDGKKVIVNSDPTTRKYIEFGCNLVGVTHSNEESKRIFGLMQYEQPEAWGRTTCREWLVGHKHIEGVKHDPVKEDNGVVVRNIPSLTATDAWHKKVGFVMASKKTMAFVYDYYKGLSDIHYEYL